jgi:hypothetical protein
MIGVGELLNYILDLGWLKGIHGNVAVMQVGWDAAEVHLAPPLQTPQRWATRPAYSIAGRKTNTPVRTNRSYLPPKGMCTTEHLVFRIEQLTLVRKSYRGEVHKRRTLAMMDQEMKKLCGQIQCEHDPKRMLELCCELEARFARQEPPRSKTPAARRYWESA